MKNKKEVLAKYLKIDIKEIKEIENNLFETKLKGEFGEKKTYKILTDAEANEEAKNDIECSAWAFNAEFILNHTNLPPEAIEMIKKFCEAECENANDTILAMIIDFDEFVKDAINTDGRGHLINNYDGEEIEQDGLFIYRID